MSLDVYLRHANPQTAPERQAIFVRRDGSTVEITREEWDAAYPGREPATVTVGGDLDDTVYDANITHNLGRMAEAAGIYKPLWRPEEIGISLAGDLVRPLEAGLARLEADPEKFRDLNPPNGWGSYDSLVLFVRSYLAACRDYPTATVSVSR